MEQDDDNLIETLHGLMWPTREQVYSFFPEGSDEKENNLIGKRRWDAMHGTRTTEQMFEALKSILPSNSKNKDIVYFLPALREITRLNRGGISFFSDSTEYPVERLLARYYHIFVDYLQGNYTHKQFLEM